MKDESLRETLLEIAATMVISVVLAVVVMAAFDLPLSPPDRASKSPAIVHIDKPVKDRPHPDVGPNP